MLSRAQAASSLVGTQARGMATLRDIDTRLKATKNIQKITKSMKVVSAAKFNVADRALKPARVYGNGQQTFFDQAEVSQDDKKPTHLILTLSSDRGLCGGIHTSLFKAIRAAIPEKPEGTKVKLICVGDKQRGLFARGYSDLISCHFAEVGKKPIVFKDAAEVANAVLAEEFDVGEMYFNKFRSVISYTPTCAPIYNKDSLEAATNINLYDSVDADVLQSYNEFAMANLIFYALREGCASELSARMTAMEGATKNAGEMIDKLTLLFNRKRQSVITSELIEIISGAAALD